MTNFSDKTARFVRCGFGVIIVLGILLSTISLYQLHQFRDSMTTIVQVNNKKSEYAHAMRDAITQRAIILRDMAAMQDVFARDEEQLKFNQYATDYIVARDKLVSLLTSTQEKKIYDKAHKLVSEAYPDNTLAARLLIQNTDQDAINRAIYAATSKTKKLLHALDELVRLQQHYAKTTVDKANRKYSTTLTLLVVAGIVAIVIAFIIVNYVSKFVEVKNKELIDATYTKSMFVANMSHEIRTPLTAIIGFAKTLLDDRLSKHRKDKAIRTILRNGEHLLGIINDILDLSKIEANKLDIEKTEFSLFDIFNDVNNILRDQAAEKGIEYNFNFTYPLPARIVSDPVRLKQILLNLCSNALKFTEQGFVHVNVRYDRFNYKLVVDVNDSGIGMTEEQQGKVFQSFTQADISTTRKFGGTGLGLPISQQLAEKLGGDIVVSSRPGEGSCFSLTICLRESSDAVLLYKKPDSHKTSSAVQQIAMENSVEGSILLVEDMPDNQELISFLLEDMGAIVVTVSNGQEALEITRDNVFDLVFMDMQMPVMSGLEALTKMREADYQAPVVMLTANAMQDEQEKCFQAGCNGFLVKPIDEIKMYETVTSYLRMRGDNKSHPPYDTSKAGNSSEVVNTDAEVITSSLIEKNAEKYTRRVIKFIGRLPQIMQQVEKAQAGNDTETLKILAHQLKGVGGNYGYPVITDIAGEFEQALLSEQITENLETYVIELKETIQKIIKGGELLEHKIA